MTYNQRGDYTIPAWTEHALCAEVGGDLWFPENKAQGRWAKEARRICGQCPVQVQCLQMALDNNEPHGIWAGLSEHQRRRLREAS